MIRVHSSSEKPRWWPAPLLGREDGGAVLWVFLPKTRKPSVLTGKT